MKKPNITKGEWTVSGLPPADGKYIFKGYDVNPICALAEWTEEGILVNDFFPKNQKANAKAISAVPEMIDALISANNVFETYFDFDEVPEDHKGEMEGLATVHSRIKQALTKAGCKNDPN